MIRQCLYFLFLFNLLFLLSSFHIADKKVQGEYTYHAPENVSLEEAKRTALERAKIQALADAFGTVVSQTNATTVRNRDGKSDVDFLSIGSSDVKGEWIETLGEPEFSVSYEEGMLVVKATVSGRAREIVAAKVNFAARVLRNGTEDKFESEEFRDGDDLYLSFCSPIAGYLAVYLLDGDGKAYCLLPYRGQEDGCFSVQAGKRYILFSSRHSDRNQVDEYQMTCTRMQEYNRIYVIFSPRHFVKAMDHSPEALLPRELNEDDFHKWLTKCRKFDRDMCIEIKDIVLKR